MLDIAVPEPVARAAGRTPAGQQWLAELPAVLNGLQQRWHVQLGEPFSGGTASYVTEVTTASGKPAVLKVALTAGIEGHGSFDAELDTLLAGGSGFVKVLAHSRSDRAYLMERLGSALASTQLPVADQLEIIAGTLRRAWMPARADLKIPTLKTKGVWLAEFVRRTWEEVGRPCPRRVVDAAVRFAHDRVDAFDPGAALVLHGDGHPWNTLAGSDGTYRLIDPDGVTGEPEYDLAIPIRELDASQLHPRPALACREHCRTVATCSDADPDVIWQWAYVERISTGLLCAQLGHEQWATALLDVADDLLN